MKDCPASAILERAFAAHVLDDVEDPALIAHIEVCENCQFRLEALAADNAVTDAGEDQLDARRDMTTDFHKSRLSASVPAAKLNGEAMPLPEVPGYEILCRLGKGGMGVVYKARHQKLNRIVALKMILAGALADEDRLARFHREAEAVARLRHPNIVEIDEIGVANGMPYFVLEYLPGGSLEQRFRQGPQPPRQSAELLAALAHAVHVAHLAGIVHRDLKPANVLLTQDGRAKITDFGVAKRLEAPRQTQTGQIIGTPAYMAPEQAKGDSKLVGPAADVYALGAILYEALTGQPPFQGKTVMKILHKVQNEEPVPPRRLAAGVPSDLETICLKALRKEPKDRYATAQEFADELDRFLHDEPVRARPLSRLEKLSCWCRRKPTLAGLLAASTGLMLMAVLASVLGFAQIRLRLAHEQTRKALTDLRDARNKEKRSLYVNDIYMVDRLYRDNQLLRARQLLEGAEVEQRGWEWHYLERITNADSLSLTGHTQPVHTLAFAPQRRWLVSGSGDGSLVFWSVGRASQPVPDGLASPFYRRLREVPGHAGPIWSVAFSADGTRLASVAGSGRKPGELIVWEFEAGSEPKLREILRARLADRLGKQAAVAYHPTRPLLAVATGWQRGRPGCLLLLDADAHEIRCWSDCGDRGCVALAWSPDGRRLAASFVPTVAASGSLAGFATTTKPASGSLAGFAATTKAASGPLAATDAGGRQAKGEVVIFDPDQVEPLHRFEANNGKTAALAFSPDGRTLACGGEDRSIELRNAASPALRKVCWGHRSAVTSLVFAPGGQLVSGSRDTTVRVWDGQSGQERIVHRGHYAPVRCLAIQPQSGRIFSGSDDITIKAWQTEKSQQGQAYRLHNGAATALAFSPDGDALISVGLDGAVWRIDPRGGQPPRLLLQERRPLRQARFLPGSQTVLVAGGAEEAGRDDGAIRLLDARDGRLSGELDTQLARVSSLSVSRDGRRLSVVGRTRQHDNAVQIWDLTAQPPRCDMVPAELLPGAAVAAQLYSGGDKLIVLLSQVNNFLKPSYVLFDLSEGIRPLGGTRYAMNGPCVAVFDKDESLLFMGGQDQGFNRFKVSPNGLFHLAHSSGHAGAIRSGALSPDEMLFATASEDETIRLWDRQTDRGLLMLRGDASPMNDVAFSPTGGFLAAAQASGAVWVWDGRAR